LAFAVAVVDANGRRQKTNVAKVKVVVPPAG
jgi:hypothetical protein